jgi:uncharacterized membrane protein
MIETNGARAMPQISFSYDVQHSIDAPLPAVFSFLADVRNIIACSSGVERSEIIDSRTAKWTLKRQEQFGLSFTPEYTLTYDFTPDNSIAWRTLDGNVAVRAQLTLSALDDRRTSVTANEEVQFAMPISPIMAKVVSAFARISTRNETLQWLKCVAGRLEQVLP